MKADTWIERVISQQLSYPDEPLLSDLPKRQNSLTRRKLVAVEVPKQSKHYAIVK